MYTAPSTTHARQGDVTTGKAAGLCRTYLLVGRGVVAHQVRLVRGQAQEREEDADGVQQQHDSDRGLLHGFEYGGRLRLCLLQVVGEKHQVRCREKEAVGCQQRREDEEEVEIAVVAPPHTVAHLRTKNREQERVPVSR